MPFTGDAASYRDIIATSAAPVVAAGGPRCDDLYSALKLMVEVIRSGARGATNLGTALAFGQMALAATTVYVLLKR